MSKVTAKIWFVIPIYILVFSPLQTFLINPENVRPENQTSYFTDPTVLENIPTTFLYMAAIYALLFLIGFILCIEAPTPKNPEEKLNEAPNNNNEMDTDTMSSRLKAEMKR